MFKDDFMIKWVSRSGKWKQFIELSKMVDGGMIQEIVEKTSMMIEDNKLRNRLGKNGKKEVWEGRFSIDERNKKLRRIYEESVH